jgi:hypothetical protein
MKKLFSVSALAVLLRITCFGQEGSLTPDSRLANGSVNPQQLSVAADPQKHLQPVSPLSSAHGSPSIAPAGFNAAKCGVGNKFSYYLSETYWNSGAFTAPAFRAGIRMANPPGKGPTRYPDQWRQGAEGFGRNYGDAFATRVSAHTAQFLAGVITREDPRFSPSSSHGFFARGSHALVFTFIDRTDSGRPMPALSNLVGASAGGFVGNAYLPAGFRDVTHAGQRATFQLGSFAAGNLFREFAPQMPHAVQTFLQLIAR